MSALVELRGVHFRHSAGQPEAVAGVSLALRPGEVVGLIGPNAAGKSTLARLACGLLSPDAGQVLLSGDPLPSLQRRERARRIALLPQQHPESLPFTARQVALMGRAPYLGLWSLEGPGDHARAEAALAEVDALQFADRPVTTLSGGERQRVFLARALAQDARALVLDEPTSALDLSHQALLVGAVRKRARAGGAALLVLHDLALAGASCDRLALLVCGEVLAEGKPADVLRPDIVGRAYGAQVDVVANPATGAPLVALRFPDHSR
jgi:iron complex transport system ATP-binding protein